MYNIGNYVPTSFSTHVEQIDKITKFCEFLSTYFRFDIRIRLNTIKINSSTTEKRKHNFKRDTR